MSLPITSVSHSNHPTIVTVNTLSSELDLWSATGWVVHSGWWFDAVAVIASWTWTCVPSSCDVVLIVVHLSSALVSHLSTWASVVVTPTEAEATLTTWSLYNFHCSVFLLLLFLSKRNWWFLLVSDLHLWLLLNLRLNSGLSLVSWLFLLFLNTPSETEGALAAWGLV